ncbi:sensor histidine kinase [Carboxylicivirga sp. N1Y90]|uniref:sensor histidine kinase n=1 Tax=Carboxylicivirga fragile TaxID=3417571 RepID=UPI003D34CE2D|nr:hypothetical protein [Marinilabiliaceae bacterium N1Y90]
MKEWVYKQFETKDFEPKEGITYWRNKVLNSILLLICLFGFIASAFGIYMSIIKEVYIIGIIDSIAYGFLLFLFLNNKLKYTFRAISLIAIPFLVSIGLLIILGPAGAGNTYLIGFTIIASILLRIKGAITSLIIAFLIIALIALGLEYKVFGELGITQYTPFHWITVASNTFAISAVVAIPLAMLVRGLENTIDQQNELQYELEDKIDQLKIAKRKAEDADVLKSKFLANMSHEVRTPLNAIIGFSEISLMEMHNTEEERRSYIKTILQNGNYLLQIIENILDFSIIEAKQLKTNFKDNDLKDILLELKDLYQIKNHKNLRLKFTIPNSAFIIKTDGHYLKQVFINLINNAIKFTDEGEINIGITPIRFGIKCYVSDTGIGIKAEDQLTIFNRFTKIDSEERFVNGTGLGLAISKGIVETLGGKIWIEANVERGTVFHFTIENKAYSAISISE